MNNCIDRNSGKKYMLSNQCTQARINRSSKHEVATHFWHMGAAILKTHCCKSVDANVK